MHGGKGERWRVPGFEALQLVIVIGNGGDCNSLDCDKSAMHP
jgi:hypothetical protein